MRRLAMWLVWNVYLGPFAPHVFAFAMKSKNIKKCVNITGTRKKPADD